MTRRTALAAIAGVLAAAVVTAGAASAGLSKAGVARNCGMIAAAGKTWRTSAAGVPCADARALVRKLAPKASGGVSHATYLGLSCLIATKQGKAAIECVGAQGRKSVIGLAS